MAEFTKKKHHHTGIRPAFSISGYSKIIGHSNKTALGKKKTVVAAVLYLLTD